MPIDYSKFDNIEDSDDEATAKVKAPPAKTDSADARPEPPVASALSSDAHRRPCDDAPDLDISDGEFTRYYSERLTSPQRMQTLVQLWNSADQTERVEFLRHLIDIINNTAISNKIKGGQEILKDLDGTFYDGVTYPTKWLDTFSALQLGDKKVAFEKCYKALDNQERGIVIGTLS